MQTAQIIYNGLQLKLEPIKVNSRFFVSVVRQPCGDRGLCGAGCTSGYSRWSSGDSRSARGSAAASSPRPSTTRCPPDGPREEPGSFERSQVMKGWDWDGSIFSDSEKNYHIVKFDIHFRRGKMFSCSNYMVWMLALCSQHFSPNCADVGIITTNYWDWDSSLWALSEVRIGLGTTNILFLYRNVKFCFFYRI